MIWCCQTKECHWVFIGSAREQVCPECGKRSLLPATREQRKSCVREQTALLRPKTS